MIDTSAAPPSQAFIRSLEGRDNVKILVEGIDVTSRSRWQTARLARSMSPKNIPGRADECGAQRETYAATLLSRIGLGVKIDLHRPTEQPTPFCADVL